MRIPTKPKDRKDKRNLAKLSVKERKFIVPKQARKFEKIPSLPHRIINNLLQDFTKDKNGFSALNLTNHAFHCLDQLIKHMPEPYPELLKHVELPLRESIYHDVQVNKPYFVLLPQLKQEEKEALEEDTKWQHRYKEAKQRNEELKLQYERDQSAALMLQNRFRAHLL